MVSINVSWYYSSVVYLLLAVGNIVSLMGHKSNSTHNLGILNTPKWTSILNKRQASMTVATVSCGSRSDDALVLLKSCLLVSPKSSIRFIVFTDDKKLFKTQLLFWKKNINEHLQYEIRKPRYLTDKKIEFVKLCPNCIFQRLFLPELLPHIDSLIYLDADCIFLSPIETLWKHFKEFSSTQLVGMSLDHELYKGTTYGKFANHPIYGKSGLNSGVALMNLTRMRAFGWHKQIRRIHHRWGNMNWCDQGYFNVMFRDYPEKLYLLYCSANFHDQYCSHDPPDCTAAVRGGIQVLHGTGGDFHKEDYPAFSTVYNLTQEFQLGSSRGIYEYYYQPLLETFTSSMKPSCGDAIISSIQINKWSD